MKGNKVDLSLLISIKKKIHFTYSLKKIIFSLEKFEFETKKKFDEFNKIYKEILNYLKINMIENMFMVNDYFDINFYLSKKNKQYNY
jgi:hypothetical protein